MIYDNTNQELAPHDFQGEPGYALHRNDEGDIELYTDDGRGNGDYIGVFPDVYWARRVAEALDALREAQ
jgi:hypothetical protein